MKKLILSILFGIISMTNIVGCQGKEYEEAESQTESTLEEIQQESNSIEFTTMVEISVNTSVDVESEMKDEIEEQSSTEIITIMQEENTSMKSLDVNNLNEDQNNMYYVMDALAESCYYEAYNPDDVDAFWSLVYCFVACNPERWADMDAEMTWMVEGSKLEQYAAGITATYQGLPEIPDTCDMVHKRPDGYYEFMPSDRGLEYTEIVSWSIYDDGTNKVIINMIDSLENDVFATYEITLIDNPQLANNSSQIFKYAVSNVERID